MPTMQKEGRTGYQYASERDAKWLESQGWTRVNENADQQEFPKSEPVSTLAKVVVKRPGRPRKGH